MRHRGHQRSFCQSLEHLAPVLCIFDWSCLAESEGIHDHDGPILLFKPVHDPKVKKNGVLNPGHPSFLFRKPLAQFLRIFLLPVEIPIAADLFGDILGVGLMFLCMGITFLGLYLVLQSRPEKHWWPLIPGGILAFMGVLFLFFGPIEFGNYILPVALIVVGAIIFIKSLKAQKEVSE